MRQGVTGEGQMLPATCMADRGEGRGGVRDRCFRLLVWLIGGEVRGQGSGTDASGCLRGAGAGAGARGGSRVGWHGGRGRGRGRGRDKGGRADAG